MQGRILGAAADNRDGIFVTSPSCVFNFGRPVELGASFARFRDEGEMGTEMVLKGKTQLFESGKLSAALIVDTSFDLSQDSIRQSLRRCR